MKPIIRQKYKTIFDINPSKYVTLMSTFYVLNADVKSLWSVVRLKFTTDYAIVYRSIFFISRHAFKYCGSEDDLKDFITKSYSDEFINILILTNRYRFFFSSYRRLLINEKDRIIETNDKFHKFYDNVKDIILDLISNNTDNNYDDQYIYNCIVEICCFDVIVTGDGKNIINHLKSYTKLVDNKIILDILIKIKTIDWNGIKHYYDFLRDITKEKKEPLQKLLRVEKKVLNACVFNLFTVKVYESGNKESGLMDLKFIGKFIKFNEFIDLIQLFYDAINCKKMTQIL